METDKLAIHVTGDVPAESPLTWAQNGMWEAIWSFGEQAADFNLDRDVDLGPGVSVATARDAVARLVAAHGITRTTFDRRSRRQRVHPEVEVPVTVVEFGEDGPALADRLRPQMDRSAFKHENELPLRIGFALVGGTVRAIALTAAHLAFDGYGASLLRDELAAELSLPGSRRLRRPALQATELAAREASAPLSVRSAATIDRWFAAMEPLPRGQGLMSSTEGTYHVLKFRSAALAIAAQTVAIRTQTTSGSVLLAALVANLLEVTGSTPAALQLIAGNRFYSDLINYVGIASENGLFVVPEDTSSSSFDDLVMRVHRSSFWGYANARYESQELLDRLRERQSRGALPDLSFYFNDARLGAGNWAGLEDEVSTLESVLDQEQSTPSFIGTNDTGDNSLFFHIQPAGRECQLMMACDGKVIDESAAPMLLSRIRSTVVAAALERDPSSLLSR